MHISALSYLTRASRLAGPAVLSGLIALGQWSHTCRGDDPPVQVSKALGSLKPVPESDNGLVPNDEPTRIVRSFLDQFRFRDSLQRDWYQTARRKLDEGQTVEAVTLIQRVFDQPQDATVWSEQTGQLESVRQQAAAMLTSLPPDALRAYETICGAEANQLLRHAQSHREPDLYRELNRRFFHTSAGFVAVDWMASWWLDHGQCELAARSWDRLFACPLHASRITPAMRRKAALAHALLGNSDRRDHIGEQQPTIVLASHSTSTSSNSLLPPEWMGAHSDRQRLRQGETECYVLLGAMTRNACSKGSPPLLHPRWSASLLDNTDEQLAGIVDQWEREQIGNLRPIAIARFALAVDGKVIFRDYAGIRALDLKTGQSVWTYEASTSCSKALEIQTENVADGGFAEVGGSRVNADFESLCAGNSTLGMISSDGKRLFAVDNLDISARRKYAVPVTTFGSASSDESESESLKSNRLIALPVQPSNGNAGRVDPLWSIGGIEGTLPNDALKGHFFLGPPLPADGRLIAVTEMDRQLNLVALRPETGELLWSQGIALVERSIDQDAPRHLLSCAPACSRGIVVCSTQLGILVAVDVLAGDLLWTYYYGDSDEVHQFGRRAFVRKKLYGHLGFPNVPQIHNDRIVYLPRESQSIHCVDLWAGKERWKAAREDAEYVAAVTDHTVVVVGSRYCRGLDLETGDETWSIKVGLPSGRGVRLGDYYVVPLGAGRTVNIEIETGREVGYALPNPDICPGNLLASNDDIVSIGLRHVQVFPQAAALLRDLDRSRQPGANGDETTLLASRLHLTLGDLTLAQALLTTLRDKDIAQSERDEAQDLLQEVLAIKVDRGIGSEPEILALWDALTRTPSQRGRYLMRRAESQLRHKDFAGVLGSTREFADLALETELPMGNDPSHLVSAASWVPEMIEQVRTHFGESELESVDGQISREADSALASGSEPELRRFLDAYPDWNQADAVRLQLARTLTETGRFQESELLLLRNRDRDDLQTSASATRELVELWGRLGLFQEAARLLDELAGRFADVPLADGQTGAEYVDDFSRSDLTWAAYQQRRAPEWNIPRVAITESRWTESDSELNSTYSQYGRRFQISDYGTFDLLDKGTASSREIAMVDRQSGCIVGRIAIPYKHSYAYTTRKIHVGHFFPLGSMPAMHGVSLLQKRIVWTNVPPDLADRQEVIKVGPAGADFCVFQARQHLACLNPANGKILWQRTDLEPNCGLHTDPNIGLIGDREVLVVFAADRQKYTVYHTATGQELRQGQLDVDVSQLRRDFGRRLLYVTSGTDARIRIWDPLTDSVDWEERIELDSRPDGHIPFAMTEDDELVLVSPTGRLRILDVATQQVRLDTQFAPSQFDEVSGIRAFCDENCYYVNFQRPSRGFHPRHQQTQYLGTDTIVPSSRVDGDFYAVDRSTGKILWNRSVRQRSILHMPDYDLPFLVGVSRLQDLLKGRKETVVIEVIDRKTGQTIGYADGMAPDRIVHLSYQRDAGNLVLHGLKTRIELGFGPDQPQVPTEDDVL